jgi:dTDP-glucose pyrophosphorylase
VPEASRRVGVLPAAGHATRLQPIPCSKEMLVVGGRPMLEHAVARLRAAEPDEIRVVTRPQKPDVVEHARRLGARVVLGEPPSLAASVALGADGLAPDDVVLLDLPDALWEPRDGFTHLLGRLNEETDLVLGVFPVDEPERSDVVALGGGDRVEAVEVKPAQPRSSLAWGCAAIRAHALSSLPRHAEPGHLFDAVARSGRAAAVCFPARFVDIGTRESLARVALPAEP